MVIEDIINRNKNNEAKYCSSDILRNVILEHATYCIFNYKYEDIVLSYLLSLYTDLVELEECDDIVTGEELYGDLKEVFYAGVKIGYGSLPDDIDTWDTEWPAVVIYSPKGTYSVEIIEDICFLTGKIEGTVAAKLHMQNQATERPPPEKW